MRKLVNIMSFLCVLYGCSDTSTSIDDDIIIKDPKVEYAKLSPYKVVVGDKLKIFNVPIKTPYYHWDLYFPGTGDWSRPDSSNLDTLYASVPLNSKEGRIQLIYYDSDTIYSDKLNTLEENPNYVKVMWSNLNHKISKKNSIYDFATDNNEVSWWGEKVEDTVKIFGERYYGEHGMMYTLFLRDNGKDALPTFIKGFTTYSYEDYPPNRRYHHNLDSAFIKLQNWNSDSLVCGKVSSKLWDYNNYIFWLEF